jgi:hypothetical protein
VNTFSLLHVASQFLELDAKTIVICVVSVPIVTNVNVNLVCFTFYFHYLFFS